MAGVNKVILVGNVGTEPESKQFDWGLVCNISVATSETWKDKNTGEKQEKTEWHRVVFKNRLAEVVDQWVKKGSKIYIEGKLTTRSWEQNGEKRYATEVEGREMQMLDSKTDAGQAAPKKAAASFDIDPADLPFD
jgi:single-strand DNA-binding protein